jgi:hypothetical protein
MVGSLFLLYLCQKKCPNIQICPFEEVDGNSDTISPVDLIIFTRKTTAYNLHLNNTWL